MKTSSFLKRAAVVALGVVTFFAPGAARAAKSSLDYVQSGLIAHWDGYENAGLLQHDGTSTTWKDLTGRHADMTFPNGTNIGATYYDMTNGTGEATCGYISDASDIATAINKSYACTVEIVCDFRSQVNDGTLFACCAGGSGKRLLWTRSNNSGAFGCIGSGEYNHSANYGEHPNIDNGVLNTLRTYAVRCASDACYYYKDGASLNKKQTNKKLANVDVTTACFSIGKRINTDSASTPVADMKVYAIRIYNRQLTDEEIAANAAIDQTRFVDGEIATENVVLVSGEPTGVGASDPAYGPSYAAFDATRTFRASVAWTNADETVRADALGWTLTQTNGTVTSGKETQKEIVFTSDMFAANLAWQWGVEYAVKSAPEVTVSSPWAAKGSLVTLTATPPTGQDVRYWTNTASTVKYTGNPIKVQVLGPMTILPVYGRARYAAVGATGSGASVGDPGDFATLLAAAVDGDVINLASGDYPISKTVEVTSPVTVRGAGIDSTILRSSNGTRILTVNNANAVIEGMTLKDADCGSYASSGAALYVGANGGTFARMRVTNSNHKDNIGGGVVYVGGPARFSRCLFDHNTMAGGHNDDQGGIILVGGAATFDNCLVCDNSATGNGGGFLLKASATIRNCTIVNNSVGYRGGGIYFANGGSGARVYNSVVAFNTSNNDSSSGAPNFSFKTASWSTSCLVDCAMNGTACGTRPQLVTAQAFESDWSPSAGSPLVDNGSSARCTAGEVDYAEQGRIIGAAVDIGCYERDTTALGAAFTVSQAQAFVDESVTFTPTIENASAAAVATWTFSNTVTHAVSYRNDKVAFSMMLAAGVYDVTLKVVDGENSTSFPVAAAVSAGPRDIYVVAGTNDKMEYPYDTPTKAHTNINESFELAVDGATVNLESDEYRISKVISLTRPLKIKGKGMGATLLRASSSGVRILYLNNTQAEVSDMTLSDANYGSYATPGSAIYIGGMGGTLARVRVTNSEHPSNIGGGVVCVAGPARVSHCVFDNNILQSGNSSDDQGGVVLVTAAATLDNCLFRDNYAKLNGGGLMITASATLRNCTVVNNRAGRRGGGLYLAKGSSGARIYNTVIAFNTADNETSTYAPNVSLQTESWASSCLVNCAVSGATACGTNPQLVTAQSFESDWSPAAGSDLINNGDSSRCTQGELDLAGNDRIIGSAVDIGCYERDTTALGASFVLSADQAFTDESVTFTPTIDNATENTVATWTISNAVTHAVIVRHDKTPFDVSLPAGVYDVALVAVDGTHEASFAQAAAVQSGPRDIYVVAGENAKAKYPYETSETAHTNVQSAIDMALQGAVVHLESPEYPISQTINMTQPITLKGKGVGSTLLRAASSGVRILYLNNTQAEVSDMTLSDANYGSYATPGSAIYIGGMGGTLARVRVTNSEHPSNIGGGVVCVAGPARVSHCVFDNNILRSGNASDDQGGVVLVTAAATLDNCLFRDNYAVLNGGGLMITASATLRNCTIVNNRAGRRGGGLYLAKGSSGARIYNTVIALNTADNEVSTYAPNVSLQTESWASSCLVNCAVSGATACGTNPQLVTAQSFEPDWSPSAGSPLIDHGNSSRCTEGELDLAGNDRIMGNAVDIGCYERDPTALGVSFTLSSDHVFFDESVTFTPVIENAGDDATAAWTISNTVSHAVISRDDKAAFTILLPAGVYDVMLTVVDGGKQMSARTESAVQSGARNVYVVEGENAGIEYPYDTPAKAHTNINAAIASAVQGAVVHLESPEYSIAQTVSVTKPVTLAGKGMNQTVLKAAGQWIRLMYVNHKDATVEDLTLTNAYYGAWNATGSALLVDGQGCAVNRVRITGSTQPSNVGGGVVYVGGSARFSCCLFDHNKITDANESDGNGGIIRVTAAATFDNCVIRDNTNRGSGGAVLFYSGASKMRNCTFVNNHGGYYGGAVYFRDSSARVYNSVFAFSTVDNDTTAYAPHVRLRDGSINSCIQYCALSDKTFGTAPQLVTADDFPRAARDNYCPSGTSACIKKGTLACWGDLAGVSDFEGRPRKSGRKIDIGAYAYHTGFTVIVR